MASRLIVQLAWFPHVLFDYELIDLLQKQVNIKITQLKKQCFMIDAMRRRHQQMQPLVTA